MLVIGIRASSPAVEAVRRPVSSCNRAERVLLTPGAHVLRRSGMFSGGPPATPPHRLAPQPAREHLALRPDVASLCGPSPSRHEQQRRVLNAGRLSLSSGESIAGGYILEQR
jgi:hypothetical protein